MQIFSLTICMLTTTTYIYDWIHMLWLTENLRAFATSIYKQKYTILFQKFIENTFFIHICIFVYLYMYMFLYSLLSFYLDFISWHHQMFMSNELTYFHVFFMILGLCAKTQFFIRTVLVLCLSHLSCEIKLLSIICAN